jgi:iron-sulfur cluster assembly protein
MFKLTAAAAAQIQAATRESGAEGMSLRLAVARRPDGSFDYRMGFDDSREEDLIIKSEGIEILMEPEFVPLLEQTVLDFASLDGEPEPQFIFINPKDPNYHPPSLQTGN